MEENEVQDLTEKQIDDKINNATKLNRAQKRALIKKHGKAALDEHTNIVTEAAKKLIYTKIIERLQKYERKEPDETTEDGETDLQD